MTTEMPYTPEDPINYWGHRYEIGSTGWNLGHAHPLADKGVEVVGVDIALQALKKFASASGQDWTETEAPKLGPDAKLLTRKDGKIKLYWGDALNFSQDVEGKFDAIFDCDGLHVLDEKRRLRFGEMVKGLLNPGGRLLLEAIAYDKSILTDENFKPSMAVPPPYSISVEDVKSMFEPECSVEILDKHSNKLLYGYDSDFYAYKVVKL
ncbi:hypothetical protein EGW08_017608 [Elysia chlorotica]|uniref:Methyltransferase domain-containing protein n=1 Tax=Elysia chlorotica TaxID=188477 RepID=A0A433SZ96_ELYCH|nr:hypothetical protein EGW08_017608 [Elysia chlorotica]